ncbi:hypothetical protein EJ082_15175 [Brevundimonas diminuta]|uniref:ParA family protein n=2 Tax=Brevundimonas diminuta TaxID=293 RepID=A0A410P068_BREDI|nr:hypothetical protein [Brevundimonas diminuta]MBD3574307.1 hypothetical protein [Brevundimonas diminuta]QAT15536.1 hypothetical protein EQG53_14960 [Brevundimonas diminuta]QQB90247.1 hypothetical protein I6H83_07490 [Brevundimonas diminuta]
MMVSEDIKTSELLSWIDVARRLSYVEAHGAGGPPPGVLSTATYWSGLTIRALASADDAAIQLWLADIFGSWLQVGPDGAEILLDAPEGMSRLPISVVKVEGEPPSVPYRPHASLEGVRYFDTKFPSRPTGATPPLYAFHSVKGGVGRTTSAIAFALDQQPGESDDPVLLVDADFEAPGISFLLQSRKANSTISFEDFLALAHADRTSDFSATLDFVTERMADQRVDNVFVLPAKRLLRDLSGFAIRPENLLAARTDDSYVVVDLIRQLAARLGCRKAVIDLRAGLVDVAVQFLSDPTVERVFVSTAGGQSIAALGSMIRTLGQIEAETRTSGRQPLVVINQMPIYRLADPEYRASIVEVVTQAADESFSPQGDTLDASIRFAFVPHLNDLIATASEWDNFVRDLSTSSFSKVLSTELRGWSGAESVAAASDTKLTAPMNEGQKHDDRCRLLQEFAEKLEVAETATEIAQPLATPPLQRLASDFLSQPPIVIVEGAKGTGKTLTSRFLMEQGSWRAAVSKLDGALKAQYEGAFIPLFGSIASSERMVALIGDSRRAMTTRLGGEASPSTLTDTEQAIKSRLQSTHPDEPWLPFWLEQIASACGFTGEDAWERFTKAVRDSDVKPVIVVEGLEEVLTDPVTDSRHAAALLSLLREVPLRFREEAGRPLGYLAFMRGDMVEATMVQNLAQFRAGYASYALTWREADIKELVIWLAGNSNAIPGLWSPDWRNKRQDEQEGDLRKIWGLKLGADDSREARSTEWVIAVLTDLTGRLTARDLVRFIGAAAKDSRSSQFATDRLLSANALKNAVEHTSRKKVEEYPKEVRQLESIFDKLRHHPGFETPFVRSKAAEIGITEGELDILETYGVAYQEDGIFEVPELFRLGLDMRRSGARPNIISLTRRARERARS